MAYEALYRRYRSRRFGEIRGQDHVVTALRNAVRDGRVGHAYLFSGPRGTGKTSTARILAKVLNCTNPADGEPCLECESCQSFEAGTSFDLHELDAASHNKVEHVRDLVERVAYSTPGRTKVYILDEVHMLSPSASAALLKTLEEPPSGVVFVLATTDPQKVIPTIRSRTQHFDFHLLPADVMAAHVRWVIDDAGLKVADDAVDYVVRAGGGSARDALSALDQVAAAGGVDDTTGQVDALAAAIVDRDTGGALSAVAEAAAAGRDPKVLASALVSRLRDVFLLVMHARVDHLSDRDRAAVEDLAGRAERPLITRAIEVLGEALVDMRDAPDQRVTLEVALVRLTDARSDTSPGALLERIERLERALAGGAAGGVGGGATDPGPAPEAQAEPSRPRSGTPSEARAALGAHRSAANATPSAAPPTVTTSAPSPAAPTTTSTATEEPGVTPTRDELTLAWGDQVLKGLPNMARALFSVGRFVESASGAAFALPSAVHREKCETYRREVEEALAAHFGARVRLQLVLDGEPPSDRPAATPPLVDEDVGDIRDLEDAHVETASGLDLFAQSFPGAQLIEDGDA